MPLPLVARVPSTSRSLFTLGEEEEVPCAAEQPPPLAGYMLTEHIGSGCSGSTAYRSTSKVCSGFTFISPSICVSVCRPSVCPSSAVYFW